MYTKRIRFWLNIFSKLKSALRLNNKNFEDEELPYELFLTTKQANKIGNSIDTKMSIDIKLSKALK